MFVTFHGECQSFAIFYFFQANSRQLIEQADIIKEQNSSKITCKKIKREKLYNHRNKKQFAVEIENQQKYYHNIIEKYKEEINSLRGELQA